MNTYTFFTTFLLFLVLSVSDTCGGANCPTGKCPTCYCGRTTNIVDINEWCSKYSWNQSCCRCIVALQSGGNANAMNYNHNGTTYVGLWQINTAYWDLCSKGEPPCDVNDNLACAIRLYSEIGKNSWSAWKTKVACKC